MSQAAQQRQVVAQELGRHGLDDAAGLGAQLCLPAQRCVRRRKVPVMLGIIERRDEPRLLFLRRCAARDSQHHDNQEFSVHRICSV